MTQNKISIPAAIVKKKQGFFSYLKNSLLKTSRNIGKEIIKIFSNKNIIDEKLFNSLTKTLITADVGLKTTKKIINLVSKYADKKKLQSSFLLYDYIKHEMLNILIPVERPLIIGNKKPFIILIIGVNGVGKTTTIGKLAYYFYKNNKSVLLASGDTFRAGADKQLTFWSNKSHSYIVNNYKKKDSASVIFDAFYKAKNKNIDILIADTAGRLHNNLNLIEELKKIVRVIKKVNNQSPPDEIMLILDANIGQNSINQLKIFHDSIGVTGITVTKVDGTAKGGIIFSLANEFGIPIRYIGSGEKITNLHLFNAKEFINAIFYKN
ncbi:signal recognition particle-docking protein FtsY [Enterobacteriaceae endosymbiont of Plateumaris consimilis]|uniref:signal recognition particle-docking protein FtsY n=1 Tax=Enterobacteriaceae endosymbiont of Plateumaris consimilis TaxID=2675794 RepID=UPI00144965B6|nr:signal recognition particle-docking protein FtsY [Enterobacteriaceae endosymbiont of Plateumaris consimilis]QJC28449.1 signal recognition particle-docking protein FtsY [Enterobacteriaceae endosymbiont of Plateumaris consimilis]